MDMKKILVLGSKGMAGHLISSRLIKTQKYIVKQVAKDNGSNSSILQLDVSRLDDLEKLINQFSPDVVVNCIGILNKVAEENPDQAIFLNSFLPHHLAKLGKDYNFKLIHISTDCVFSGHKGNYDETDIKDGIGFYAQSKALGEVTYGQHLTIRTSIVGPEIKPNGIGLLHWFLTTKDSEIKGYQNAYWGGVTTLQLSVAIENAIENHDIKGLIHLTNGLKISKYDLLQVFKDVFSKSMIITSDSNYQVDKSLAKGPLTFSLGEVPSYEIMIRDMHRWMEDNKSLYSSIYSF